MKFAFNLCQRVIAPGSEGRIQGIVIGASAMVGAENQYVISVLTDEGKSGSVGYGEAVLLAAQKVTFVKAK